MRNGMRRPEWCRRPSALFLDDDVELAANFIESMERLLDHATDAVAATGFLVIDGARSARGDAGMDRSVARFYAMNYVREHANYDHGGGAEYIRTLPGIRQSTL